MKLVKKTRVLIVDEHAAVRKALARRLASDPALEVVGTAARADDLQSVHADILLLGLQNQKHSLRQTVDTVRTVAEKGIVVIVLAPYASDVEQEHLLHAGAWRYFLKEINTLQLKGEIEAAMARRQ